MRYGQLVPVVAPALLMGCSAAEDTGAPLPTVAEQRALADASAMIPANELPSAAPSGPAIKGATDDQ